MPWSDIDVVIPGASLSPLGLIVLTERKGDERVRYKAKSMVPTTDKMKDCDGEYGDVKHDLSDANRCMRGDHFVSWNEERCWNLIAMVFQNNDYEIHWHT